MNNQFILYCLAIPLGIVVFTDLFYRKIHNHIIVLLLLMVIGNIALFFIGLGSFRYLSVEQASAQLGWSAIGAVLVLIAGFGLFSIGQMGAGDAKLMAVLCLMVGGDNQVTFLLITALAGGVMAVFMPVVRLIEVWAAMRLLQISTALPWLHIPVPDAAYSKPGTAGMPYGLAISVGAVLSLTTPLTH